MTEEEIKKIAREYAHLRAFDGGFFPKEDEIAEDFQVCLQLLSKDYCIVPKEVVMAIYNRKTIPTNEDVKNKFVEECVITAIFPELFE